MDRLSHMAGGIARRSMAFLRSFGRAGQGNVAIFFALALIPILAGAAGAIDFSRAYIVRERLTSALDAAGLAVGSMPDMSQEELQARAQSFFEANYPEGALGTPGALLVSEEDGTITLNATAALPTTLLKIVGMDELSVGASVSIVRESTGVELVMVLDNTGSMAGSRIRALKDSSRELIEILFGDENRPEKVRVSIVPFAAGVNVGAHNINAPWMDTQARSSIHGENFRHRNNSSQTVNIFDLYNQIRNRAWNGCVETRPEPYDETNEPPSLANPDTLWVPWFAPDEPDNGNWIERYYSYLSDGTPSNWGKPERQRDTEKYRNATVPNNTAGPHNGCDNLRPITPLTNDKQLLLREIDAMVATGATHIPIGLAWGWRVISPSEPFTGAAAYDDRDWRKVIILMTDGENFMGNANNHNGSIYSAYGYVTNRRLGTASPTQAVQRMDQKLARVCDNVKDEGIRLYTITFLVNAAKTRNLMRDCATTPNMYFDSPDSATLNDAFRQIANELNALRIAR